MNYNNQTQIIIDPICNLHYSAFYVLGLNKLFFKKIRFSHKPFKELLQGRRTCFLFILNQDYKEYKIAIDFHDSNSVDKNVLSWCDVYAKINYHKLETIKNVYEHFNSDEFENNINKIITIPPSFGVNVFNVVDLFRFFMDIIFSKSLKMSDKKIALNGALRMFLKRKPLEFYKPKQSKSNFIFHISSIWAKDAKSINFSRANFIRACKFFKDLKFEGGLVDIGYDYSYMGNIDNIIYKEGKVGLKKYVLKTSESRLVFNGPSVLKCHGWKLAEYLALGKAILSTPLYNDLAVPLTHGENIHFIEDDYESIREGIKYLIENPNYVNKLEKGALKYWNEHLQPSKVIEKIINFVKEIENNGE